MILYVDTDTEVRDEGTVVVLTGRNDAGRVIRFVVDHRSAQDILNLIGDGLLTVEVEPWQILGPVAA